VEGRGTHWPNITPLRSSDHTPLQSDAARYTFLVFEQEDSSLGTELILDFSSMEQVEIRTVLSENEVRTYLFPQLSLTSYSYQLFDNYFFCFSIFRH